MFLYGSGKPSDQRSALVQSPEPDIHLVYTSAATDVSTPVAAMLTRATNSTSKAEVWRKLILFILRYKSSGRLMPGLYRELLGIEKCQLPVFPKTARVPG